MVISRSLGGERKERDGERTALTRACTIPKHDQYVTGCPVDCVIFLSIYTNVYLSINLYSMIVNREALSFLLIMFLLNSTTTHVYFTKTGPKSNCCCCGCGKYCCIESSQPFCAAAALSSTTPYRKVTKNEIYPLRVM